MDLTHLWGPTERLSGDRSQWTPYFSTLPFSSSLLFPRHELLPLSSTLVFVAAAQRAPTSCLAIVSLCLPVHRPIRNREKVLNQLLQQGTARGSKGKSPVFPWKRPLSLSSQLWPERPASKQTYIWGQNVICSSDLRGWHCLHAFSLLCSRTPVSLTGGLRHI